MGEHKKGELHTGVVIGGASTTETNLYVGRGFIRHQLIPGMVFTDEEPYQLHTLYDGKVNTMTTFEVLVIKPEVTEAVLQSTDKQEVKSKVRLNSFYQPKLRELCFVGYSITVTIQLSSNEGILLFNGSRYLTKPHPSN